MSAIGERAALLRREWETDPRWAGITRDYSAQDVIRLRGSAAGEHGLARRGASRLWGLLHSQDSVRALGGVAGDQAVQLVKAGLQAIYLPGWQPGDGNLARHGDHGQPLAPVVVGAGGAPDAFELMKAMIPAGAAGVRFDDQLPADDARGHSGQQVLIPTGQHIETLTAAGSPPTCSTSLRW